MKNRQEKLGESGNGNSISRKKRRSSKMKWRKWINKEVNVRKVARVANMKCNKVSQISRLRKEVAPQEMTKELSLKLMMAVWMLSLMNGKMSKI